MATILFLTNCTNSANPATKSNAQIDLSTHEGSLSQLINAEFAAHRGQDQISVDQYFALAQSSDQIDVVQRATEIAMAFNRDETALNLTEQWLNLDANADTPKTIAAQLFARSGEVEGGWLSLQPITEQNAAQRAYAARVVTAETRRLNSPEQLTWLANNMENEVYLDDQLEGKLALALAYDGLKQYNESLDYAKEAIKIDPAHLLATQLAANAYSQTNERLNAAKLINQWLLSANPEAHDNDSWQHMALLMLQLSPEYALQQLELAPHTSHLTPDIRLKMAQQYIGLDQTQAAIYQYQKLLKFGEQRQLALFNIGRVHHLNQQPTQALAHYRQVSESPLVATATGYGYELMANEQERQNWLNQQQQRFPEQAAAMYRSSIQALYRMQESEQAIHLLRTSLQQFPDDINLLYMDASLALDAKNLTRAEQSLRRIIKQDENNAQALNALGYGLTILSTRYEEALQLIKRALALQPEDAATIDSMGWILYKLGRYPESVEYLSKAAQLFYDGEVLSHLVMALIKVGEVKTAIPILVQALKDFPDSEHLLDIQYLLIPDA